jgi:hypothetical protein
VRPPPPKPLQTAYGYTVISTENSGGGLPVFGVFGIVNLEGELEQLAVKESPDPAFNAPVLEALSKWVFKPAKQNGEPARAKVLIGIPLWLPN